MGQFCIFNYMPKNKPKKVAVALSGGVDSAVAAALLKQQGYDCLGLFMKFWSEPGSKLVNKCCSLDAYNDARIIAHKLGFPIYTLNFKSDFKKNIVDSFLNDYSSGLTPNPCVRCNKFIKFGRLLEKAKMLGCDYLATGHYVRIVTRNKRQETKKNLSLVTCHLSLKQAKDKQKDQSYFLYTLDQRQLGHLLFPLGNLTKPQVRQLAKKFMLPVYQKSESQEICFVPEKDHYSFLKKYLNLKPGTIKNSAGQILGQHDGLPLYTLGQRQGIKIGGTGPYYVVKLDYKNNVLFVSNNHNDKLLLTKKFKIKEANWIAGQSPKNIKGAGVKIRYQAKTIPAKINNNIVTLQKPQRAIMPGQSAVFYQGDKLLGGGIITN